MKIHKFACYFTSERPRVALYIMCLCMATKETWGSEWEVFRGKWKIRKKEVQKLWSLHRKKCTLLIFTRHDVIFAMIYSFMWVNRVACISRQKCETLIARKYPFNETSEMIYVVDDVLLDVVCVCVCWWWQFDMKNDFFAPSCRPPCNISLATSLVLIENDGRLRE